MKKDVIYTGFELYQPELTEENVIYLSIGAGFLKDKDGNDWYEIQKYLSKNYPDAYFLTLDHNNVVVAVTKDVSTYFPAGLTVLVTYNVPDKIEEESNLGSWRYDNGKFISHNGFAIEDANLKMEKELTWATNQISAIQDLEELQGLSEEQKDWLGKVKLYRATLIQINVEDAPNITWPTRPKK